MLNVYINIYGDVTQDLARSLHQATHPSIQAVKGLRLSLTRVRRPSVLPSVRLMSMKAA